MGLKDKILNFVAPIDEVEDEDEYEYVEDNRRVEPTREVRRSAPVEKVKKVTSSGNTQMVLFEPRSFDEAEEIARHLKHKKACVVNLHRLQRDYAQRTIDFLTGTVFALDGTIQKIAHNTILLTPSSMGVDGTISLDNNEYWL